MPTSRAFCAAPRHVYAGTILNKTSKPIVCTIHYSSGPSHNRKESISVTLDSGSQTCIPEREYQPTPQATFTCRKIVSRIDVQTDEQTFSIEQPFDGVTYPVTEWRFNIYNDHIASVNPNIPINTSKSVINV